jgi:hypothetical protein
MDHELKNKLGRIPSVDFRDRKFLARPKTPPASRTAMQWITAKPLDQGDSPMCVAFAWEQYLLSSPVRNKLYKTPQELYHEAQAVDEWPDDTPYDGTSVRAGAKVLSSQQRIKEYNWAFDVDTAIRYVLTSGPIVLGIDWYDTMFYPFVYGKDKQHFIRLGGDLAGGHAILCKGVNTKHPCWCGEPGAARLINSWGESWGDGGKVWICLKELDKLIKANGECAMAAELKFFPQT